MAAGLLRVMGATICPGFNIRGRVTLRGRAGSGDLYGFAAERLAGLELGDGESCGHFSGSRRNKISFSNGSGMGGHLSSSRPIRQQRLRERDVLDSWRRDGGAEAATTGAVERECANGRADSSHQWLAGS